MMAESLDFSPAQNTNGIYNEGSEVVEFLFELESSNTAFVRTVTIG